MSALTWHRHAPNEWMAYLDDGTADNKIRIVIRGHEVRYERYGTGELIHHVKAGADHAPLDVLKDLSEEAAEEMLKDL